MWFGLCSNKPLLEENTKINDLVLKAYELLVGRTQHWYIKASRVHVEVFRARPDRLCTRPRIPRMCDTHGRRTVAIPWTRWVGLECAESESSCSDWWKRRIAGVEERLSTYHCPHSICIRPRKSYLELWVKIGFKSCNIYLLTPCN